VCNGSACYTSCTPGTTAQCKSTTCDATGSCGPRGNGQMCSAGADCQSNNCVDGVCCDTPLASCNNCYICNGSTPGKCAPATANTDPHNVCNASASTANNCTGANCNGSGSCGGRPGVCNASCSGSQLTQAQCDGTSTTCPSPSAGACPGFLICADSASCKQTCSGDGDCVSGYWCNLGNCAAKYGTASSCSAGNQCQTGSCVDGVCCQQSSCSGCYACNVGTSSGHCAAVPMGQDPHHVCSADACYLFCDGSGGCLFKCSGNSVCKCGGMCLASGQSCP
jgi:hypothetical protein